jgi:hypothetical protein
VWWRSLQPAAAAAAAADAERAHTAAARDAATRRQHAAEVVQALECARAEYTAVIAAHDEVVPQLSKVERCRLIL